MITRSAASTGEGAIFTKRDGAETKMFVTNNR